jgi:WXG100 family type VII secretion target
MTSDISDSGSFSINYEDMNEVLSLLNTETSNIDDSLNTLNANLTKYLASFQGSSGDVYREIQAQWNNAAKSMQNVLSGLQKGGGQIVDNYIEMDRRGANTLLS